MNVVTSSLPHLDVKKARPLIQDVETKPVEGKMAKLSSPNEAGQAEPAKPSAPMMLANKSLLPVSSLIATMQQGDIAPTDMSHAEKGALQAFDGAKLMQNRLIATYGKHARETEDQDRPQPTSTAVTA